MSRGSKLAAQRRHARMRARQRFGLTMTRDVERGLVDQIRDGKANRVTVWRVRLPDGEVARAVYDTDRGTIVTLIFDGPEWPIDRGGR